MSKICTNCGKELSDNVLFCTECGMSIVADEDADDYTVEQPEQQPEQQPVPTPEKSVDDDNKKAENTPMKVLSYFLLSLLFAVPGVGLISSLLFGIISKNINCKRFAWSSFIWNCIIMILLIVAIIVFLVVICAFIKNMNSNGEFDAIKDGLKTLIDSFKNIGEIGNMPS